MKTIHDYEISLNEAINNQTELGILINKLNNDYNPRSTKKVKDKNRVLESAKKLSDARDEIINFFEKGIFLYKNNTFKTKEEGKSEDESKDEIKENKLEKIKNDYNKFFKYTENESEGINYGLFGKYFNNVLPSALAKELLERKDKNKNNKFVNVIKSGLRDLKDEIKKMSEDEKKLKNQIKH